jgi:hypothetical protein
VSCPAAPFFSLVLATFGRTDELGRMFDSLAGQSFTSFEVIVVDQNPDDRVCGHVSAARHAGLQVSHLRLERPNLSGARNLGVDAARGRFVGFPDDDCWYEIDTLQRMHDALTGSPGLDGAIARWTDVDPENACDGATRVSLDQWRRFRGGDASSITLFLRRERLVRLGGFDPRIGVGRWYGAGEETDLLLRLLGSGAQLARVPASRVRHRPPEPAVGLTWSRLQARRARARGVGAIYVKHRLSPWTVGRGLAAPIVNGLRGREGGNPVAGLAFGFATSIGRLEGALRWLANEPTFVPDTRALHPTAPDS